ncbi:MAG: hypothetical protein HWE10_05455 [Gammaproteobacteria bacterium]|nr:hypothetical protein [Gammaproteobacteria bacterium]
MHKRFIQNILFIILASSSAVAQNIEPMKAEPSKLASKFLLTDIASTGNSVVAVGERGHILVSNDGETWQQANVPVNVLLTSISFKNEQVGFATGHDATLIKTVDGGLNWSLVHYEPKLDKPFLSIIANKTNIMAVGAYGLFMSSSDGGDEWNIEFQDELLLEGDKEYLDELKEYEPDLYLTERQFMLPHFNDITLISGEYFLAGEAGFLATSVDGQNWQRIETDYFGSYFSVIGNGNKLYLAGLRGNLFESNDAGLSWQNINTAEPATINSGYETSEFSFFFANSGNLFYRINNGEMQHHVFDDGKAILSGLVFDNQLILATEAGIKKLDVSELSSK